MNELTTKRELEAQLTLNKRELLRLESCEEELLQNIPKKGFNAATERACFRDRITCLCDGIWKIEQRLKGIRGITF
jgi:hypothetical protein